MSKSSEKTSTEGVISKGNNIRHQVPTSAAKLSSPHLSSATQAVQAYNQRMTQPENKGLSYKK
ncbi:hypothetical protein [Microscilla marina]|uniref:Uncharacterized protein n=1 Tax=Microscilla marina ATCC 23134 TaxID=313606 RepID=A1ZE91_MICM2|nr:hypothetical protein [Microscilla marina]EAY31399.1 hypothetical protein M23134_04232 [Microscilla marina ATCC 23134]